MLAALKALVADLREQLETLAREKSRDSGNSSLPPSSDDAVSGRAQPSRQQTSVAAADRHGVGQRNLLVTPVA